MYVCMHIWSSYIEKFNPCKISVTFNLPTEEEVLMHMGYQLSFNDIFLNKWVWLIQVGA